jgi:hypothetical protein
LGSTLGFLVGISQTPAVGAFLSGFLGLIGGGGLALMAGAHSEVKLSPGQIRSLGRALMCFCVFTVISVFAGGAIRTWVISATDASLSVAERFGDKLDPATLAKLTVLEQRLGANGVDDNAREKIIDGLVSKYSQMDVSVHYVEEHVTAMQRRLFRVNKLLMMLNNNHAFLSTADASKWKALQKPGPPFDNAPHPDLADIDDSTPNSLTKLVGELAPKESPTTDIHWGTITSWLTHCLNVQHSELDGLLNISAVGDKMSSIPTKQYVVPCKSIRPE